MADDRWTIRGVSPDVQRAVAERAKAERRTVGEVVTEALNNLLLQPTVAVADERLQALLDRFDNLDQRLIALEARPLVAVEERSPRTETEPGEPRQAPSLVLADVLAQLVDQVEGVLGRGDPNVRLARRAAAGDRIAYRELTVAIARLPGPRRTRLAALVAAVDAALIAAGG